MAAWMKAYSSKGHEIWGEIQRNIFETGFWTKKEKQIQMSRAGAMGIVAGAAVTRGACGNCRNLDNTTV